MFKTAENLNANNTGLVGISDFAELLTKEVDGFGDLLADATKSLGKEINKGRITLRSLRMNRGISQTQLAKELGTSQSHIARIENRPEAMMIGTAIKLSKALRVDVSMIAALAEGTEIGTSND
jgi:DNA-binding XRE family transcriptional regulator